MLKFTWGIVSAIILFSLVGESVISYISSNEIFLVVLITYAFISIQFDIINFTKKKIASK